jgi:hypothetical protein
MDWARILAYETASDRTSRNRNYCERIQPGARTNKSPQRLSILLPGMHLNFRLLSYRLSWRRKTCSSAPAPPAA